MPFWTFLSYRKIRNQIAQNDHGWGAGKMDFINLTVKNWIEYNGRADVKHATWFRMSNSIFDEPELDDKPGHTVLVWLYILSMASKKGTPSPRIHFSHGSRMCQISEKQFRDSVNDLASIGWVSAGTDAEAEAALEEGLIKAKARNAVKTAVKNGSLKSQASARDAVENHTESKAIIPIIQGPSMFNGCALLATKHFTRKTAYARARKITLQTDRQT